MVSNNNVVRTLARTTAWTKPNQHGYGLMNCPSRLP
jgi:hypothetical protein